jgi:Icc protein
VLVSSFSQHPSAERVLVHISDTHLLDGRRLFGSIDSDTPLRRLLERLVASGQQVDALVFTGDLADRAESGAYLRLRELVEPFALQLGAPVVWVMGNHDEREPFSEVLFGGPATAEPQDRVCDLDGLRVIALDTSVPGYHHGELTPAQLEWLGNELASPAPKGTILALHHPPIPTPIELMGVIELQDQGALARVIEGTDVRGLLAGHLHYSTFSTFAGVPVSVCAASCYTIDLLGIEGTILSAVPGGLSASLVHVYPDQLVFSTVPLEDSGEITHYDAAGLAGITAITAEQRREMFSNKNSEFNRASDREQSGF